MKKKFVSKSAFFNLRVLLGFFLCLGGAFLALIAFSFYSAPSALAQNPKQTSRISAAPKVIPMVGPISQDRDLRTLPYIPSEDKGGVAKPRKMRHPRFESKRTEDPIQAVREVVQAFAMPTPIATYPGITSAQSACNCLPPDTQGDVGPNHYIHSVNSRFKILISPATTPRAYDLQYILCPDGASEDALRPQSKQRRPFHFVRSSG